ncbi:hypothetical protein IFR05_014937 [Cadophora sp. M221]|nr:hypothetical protein IFR05_014937 [Cadophora sp. M221]
MTNLASTFWNQGRWKEAEELQATELEICSRVLGAEHPFTLTSMANLASTFWNQGRWKEAEDLEVQVMETSLRVLGTLEGSRRLGGASDGDEFEGVRCGASLHADHMNNLAFTWKGLGRDRDAIELMKECVALRTIEPPFYPGDLIPPKGNLGNGQLGIDEQIPRASDKSLRYRGNQDSLDQCLTAFYNLCGIAPVGPEVGFA